ncbi:DUF4476 domain-containing protein [Hyalangium rubrum]|uniref:DUF4476 domain-containing protein n=1 Tax=Hyalangium rubrum TaxID=3103134 RepID=A0ABU5H9L2_9BACT|nr:DUF4476 domain-containing protein [Hyalangium sp. s54d21]MDY7229529.1 DUF4476 domain-containing protein [Hyalangium sp. s54d21]
MRAFVVAVAVLMSAAAGAQSAQSQDLKRSPPPGQPTGPITQPAPSTPGYPGPGYDNSPPDSFRREGTLVVVERERLLERLAKMEELLDRAMERSDRQGRRVLTNLGDELDTMRAAVNNAPDVRRYQPRPQPPPPPPAPAVQPISETQLDALSRAMNRESFSDGKLRVLESGASQQYFLVPQVLKMIQKFTFLQDKLQVARVLWPRVLDRDNAYQLYSAFQFSSDKEELKRIIEGR